MLISVDVGDPVRVRWHCFQMQYRRASSWLGLLQQQAAKDGKHRIPFLSLDTSTQLVGIMQNTTTQGILLPFEPRSWMEYRYFD